MNVSDAEPIMLEQISRISQQIGYYLHRASMRGSSVLLSRELHPVAPLLDKLTSALNKVYQRKGVNINLDISPEISFVGEQNDFVEVMGNVLDNACKYCLEFVEISAHLSEDQLHILVEDDGLVFRKANGKWCLTVDSVSIRYDQGKALDWRWREKSPNSMTGRLLQAIACWVARAWKLFLAASSRGR